MSVDTDVAVVGAGPYGLSIAAHLSHRGVRHRVIGRPMHEWIAHMPKGMLLKSEGFASSLYDLENSFTLRHFCAAKGVPYAELGVPVPRDLFVEYGLAFQKRYVPQVDNRALKALEAADGKFSLLLDDGSVFSARRVVLAVGIEHFAHLPQELSGLSADLLSHSSNVDVTAFAGREVTVIGAGASAVDVAALLHEWGTKVTIVMRGSHLKMHGRMELPRSLWQRLSRPVSTIGPSWTSCFYAGAPNLFRLLPQATRLRIVKDYLGPAGGWFMRERILGQVPIVTHHHLREAKPSADSVTLRFATSEGSLHQWATQHVIAATGYKIDVRRLPFLNTGLLMRIRTLGEAPALSAHFESSLPGLYFVGPASANSFGPVMRFAAGAKFTAYRLGKHLAAGATDRISKPQMDRSHQAPLPGGCASPVANHGLSDP